MEAALGSGGLWMAVSYLAVAAIIILFVSEVRKMRWSRTGLVVAIGSGMVAAIHSQTIADLDRNAPSADYLFGMLRIGSGPVVTLLGALVFAGSLSAMIIALRNRNGRGMWVVAAVCIYCLLGLGGGAFMMILSGSGAIQFQLGGRLIELPSFVGTTLFFVLFVGPFIAGLPWAIQRSVIDSGLAGRDILRRYTAVLGLLLTAFVLLAIMLVSSQLYGIQKASDGQLPGAAAANWLELLPLLVTLGLLLAASVAAFLFFRRNFLLPAIVLLEGASKADEEIDLNGVNALWQPWATAINAGRAELRDSRAQLIGFFDNLPTSIYLKKIDHEVVYVSKHLAGQYGTTPEEMIGKHEYDLHIESMKPLLKAMDEHITSTGQAVLMEGKHLQFERLELVSRFPVFNEQGEITHIGGMNFDIDARAKAQAELTESKALFEAFIQNAPNPMVLMDVQGRYLMFNKATAANFGMSPEEMLALDAQQIASRFPDAETVNYPMLQRVMTNLTMESAELKFEMPTGEIREFYFSFFPILGADGKLAYIGNISHDITEERRAQAELATSTNALHQSEKLAALGQLLAGVAHELNNPLAIVLGRAAILKDKLAGTPHVDSIQKLRDAADRCARIVKTFLAMARQTGPRRSVVQINALIEGALDMTAYGLRTANIELEQKLDPLLPAIEADEDQIVQLLINLIVNAQHALEIQTGERRLIVRTMFEKTKRQAVIEVMDNGPGVPADVAARIFEPFFTTKGVGDGTGLGLSVCKGMVEAHGGTLTLHETRGGGATFRATFPLLETLSADVETDRTNTRTTVGHLFLVDDEPEIAAILADCLAPLGLTCAIVGDGQSALDLIGNTHFDAVFCDVRMPGMEGIAFLARIKTDHPELASRLAFVSGDVLHRDLARLRAASDRPIIEKPFDPQLVRDVAMLLLAPAGETQ